MILTGPALQRNLADAFPLLRECVRNRETGLYTLDFYHPGWGQPVQPARHYADAITHHMSNAQVVNTYQIKKEYLPEQPIVVAQVTVRLTEFAVGDTVRLHIKAADMTKTIQRKSTIHEVKQSPMTGTTYYRVTLMEGMDNYWVSEDTLIEVNPRSERTTEKIISSLPSDQIAVVRAWDIPRERALMIIPEAA